MTIVINKMDDALGTTFDETNYSKKEVIILVKEYFCQTIFNCSTKMMRKGSVILACGTWASYARCLKVTPLDRKLHRSIEMETMKMRDIDELEVEKNHPDLAEYPLERKAEILEIFSNMKELQDR